MTKIVSRLLFALLALGANAAAQTGFTSAGWSVTVIVMPTYPTNVRADLNVQLVFPIPTSASISNFDSTSYTIVPRSPAIPKPSHVTLQLSAVGIAPTTLTTDILHYDGPFATAVIRVPIKLHEAPELQQAAKVIDETHPDIDTFEVTIFNPSSAEMSVTGWGLLQEYETGYSCAAPQKVPLFVFHITVLAKRWAGTLTGLGDSFSYPVDGQATYACDVASVHFYGKFDYAIPARQHVFLRFSIDNVNWKEAHSQLGEQLRRYNIRVNKPTKQEMLFSFGNLSLRIPLDHHVEPRM